jgi:predicted PurR-regulated permease PerM
MSDQAPSPASPKWGSMTKMVVGLTVIAIIAAMLVQFRTIIGPLLLAIVLSYLLFPVASLVSRLVKLPWRASVNLIYLLVVLIYLGLITVTGLTVVTQLQSLINFVRLQVTDLPALAANLSSQQFRFGPFIFSLGQFDLKTLSEQLISAVQPLLGRMGTLISSFATGAAASLGWSFFVILISYFFLADAGKFPGRLVSLEIPGYDQDIRRLGEALKQIWNAYLRGQLIIIGLVMISYTVLMLILGVKFAIGLAILAGLARFVPYVGPLTTGIVTVLVAFFQAENYFGLVQWQYALMVVVLAVVLDQIFDNLISPRLLGASLGVHPAGVLIAAIVAANLIGIIGLVLAAPVLATLNLLARYIFRKMFDLDPWMRSEEDEGQAPRETLLTRWRRRMKALDRFLRRRPS